MNNQNNNNKHDKQQINSQRLSIFNIIEDIIKNYEFAIKYRYVDHHPLMAYIRLFGYMGVKKENKILNKFTLSLIENYQLQPLCQSFYPYIKQTRETYLQTTGLKLQLLPRKRIATQKQKEDVLYKWKQFYQIQELIKTDRTVQINQQDQSIKRQFIQFTNFGWKIQKKFVVQGYGKQFFYAVNHFK